MRQKQNPKHTKWTSGFIYRLDITNNRTDKNQYFSVYVCYNVKNATGGEIMQAIKTTGII